MTDIDLLPLVGTLRAMPEHVQRVVQAYARANVDHATALLQAEIEALRAEVDGTIRELLAERDQLAAALEAAREDAERWRSLMAAAKEHTRWSIFDAAIAKAAGRMHGIGE